jgi:hypothetical protein
MGRNAMLCRLAISLVRLGFLFFPAFSTVYYVRPDGSGDYPTIQSAIDATIDGDTVARKTTRRKFLVRTGDVVQAGPRS